MKLVGVKKLVTPLIEECTETVEEVKLAKITIAENENSYKCCFYTVYIVLMIVVPELLLILFIAFGLCLKIMVRTSNLVPVLKQRFNKLINGKSQTN